MRLNALEEKRFSDLLSYYLNNENVLKMKNYVAHGRISVYEHSLNVAKCAYYLNSRFKMRAQEKRLLVAAMLHDFYLYDWHDAPANKNIFKMHGFTHPIVASENAKKIFGIDEETQKIIQSHMWPLTMLHWPSSKEAWILTTADKIVALDETLFKRK